MPQIQKTFSVLLSLALLSIFLNVQAQEKNADACDCKTITLSDEEAQNGCPASVKDETCPLFHDAAIKKEQLQREQQLREMQKRTEPRYTVPR